MATSPLRWCQQPITDYATVKADLVSTIIIDAAAAGAVVTDAGAYQARSTTTSTDAWVTASGATATAMSLEDRRGLAGYFAGSTTPGFPCLSWRLKVSVGLQSRTSLDFFAWFPHL